jgi:hypothetical protein
MNGADLARDFWSRLKVVKSHMRRPGPSAKNDTTPKRSSTGWSPRRSSRGMVEEVLGNNIFSGDEQ